MNRILITGDKHGDFSFLESFINLEKTDISDTLIILGDAGINYYVSSCDEKNNKYKLSKRAKKTLTYLSTLPITLFCIQGNHEARPETIKEYKEKIWNEGIVYYQEKAPNILFAKNGEIYNINQKKFLVIGGAYSVDKHYRLQNNYAWFDDEQLNENEKNMILNKIKNLNVDYVLTHTCPYKYIPVYLFLSFIDQSTVDNSMEYFLDEVEQNLNYKKWYFGHYHSDEMLNKNKNFHMLFNTYEEL